MLKCASQDIHHLLISMLFSMSYEIFTLNFDGFYIGLKGTKIDTICVEKKNYKPGFIKLNFIAKGTFPNYVSIFSNEVDPNVSSRIKNSPIPTPCPLIIILLFRVFFKSFSKNWRTRYPIFNVNLLQRCLK